MIVVSGMRFAIFRLPRLIAECAGGMGDNVSWSRVSRSVLQLLFARCPIPRPPEQESRRWHSGSSPAIRSCDQNARKLQRFLGIVLGVWIGIVSPSAASATDDLADRWIPGFSVRVGARIIPVDAATVSSDRGDFEGESNRVFGTVGGGLQLLTPVVADHPLAPRILFRVAASTFFDQEDRVVNEGASGALEIPFIDNNNDGIPDAEPAIATITGQGSATGVKTEVPSVRAAIGLDFEFEVAGRQLHIKPSVEWLYERERVGTILGLAEAIGGDPDVCPCRTATAFGENTEDFHSLGPGIEVEFATGRISSFMVSVFAQANGYYLFDRKVNVGAVGEWSDASGTVTVLSGYERARWDYRLGAGVRFNWMPE